MFPKVVILIPVYNNADAVGGVVRACRGLGFPVFVVDDGSTDGSGEKAREAGATVLRFRKNRGKGAALRSGFGYLKIHRPDADFIVTLDADGQHNPEDIPRLLEAADMPGTLVIGSRIENIAEMPLFRFMANRTVSYFVSRLLGKTIRDTQSGFRVLPRTLAYEAEFYQKRYGIETEMLFRAQAMGIAFKEIPVWTVYRTKNQISWKKDLTNAKDIIAAAFAGWISAAFRKGSLHGILLGKRALILQIFILTLLVFQVRWGMEVITGDGYFWRKLSPSTRTRELLAVTAWLKENTPDDAVIMAPRHEGHKIMAFADRRVITSSKVYPSEVFEIASRERDIARFFFSTNYDDAREILEKYRATYVFLPLREPGLGMCKDSNLCHWVTVGRKDPQFFVGDLTPEGRQRTLIGKFLGRAEPPGFAKVWDSENFVVYRVVERTYPAECELSDDEKRKALSLARAAFLKKGSSRPDAAISEKRCEIALAVWQDGTLVGYRVGEGGTLDENIRQAASDISEERQLRSGEFSVEIAVWQSGQVYPLAYQAFRQQPLDYLRAYRLEASGARSYFFPFLYNAESFGNTGDLISYLCRAARQEDGCIGANVRIAAFSPVIFMEDGEGRVREFTGPVSSKPELVEWNEVKLRSAVRSALDWILGLGRKDGTFRNFIDPLRPTEEEVEPRDAALDTLGTWALAEGYARFRDERYLGASEKGLATFARTLEGGEPIRINALSFALFSHLKLWEATGDARHRDASRKYAGFLEAIYNPKGFFPARLKIEGGSALAADEKKDQLQTYIAFWALSEYFRRTGEEESELLKNLSYVLQDYFTTGRIVDPDLSVADTSRLASGFSVRNPHFAILVARWLLEHQYGDDYPAGIRGAFRRSWRSAYISANETGRTAEGLALALNAVRRTGKNPAIYEAGLRRAFSWLMGLQYDDASLYIVPTPYREAFRGGIRSNMVTPEAVIGGTAHFALAGMWYFDFLEGGK